MAGELPIRRTPAWYGRASAHSNAEYFHLLSKLAYLTASRVPQLVVTRPREFGG